MAATPAAARISRLAQSLQERGIDAYLAHSPVTMRYLHGFAEGAGERFMALAIRSDGSTSLICPALSENQARRAGIEDVREWRDGEQPLALFEDLAHEWNLKSAILAVDDEMPARQLLEIQSVLPAALFRSGNETLSALTRRKDREEILTMRRAAGIADRAISAGLDALRAGATERTVSEALASAMRAGGGTPSFAIVATGANGAEPHHLTDDTTIAQGDVVVMDFGCDLDGYQSDITRTASLGAADDEAMHVYRIVYEAHRAARDAIRPGVAAGAVDAAARKVIDDAGYGKFFVHRTGHGIGMRVHEEPNIAPGSAVALEEGDCFSIEPGIYLPGRFGVRIENIVAVTKDGHDSLDEEPAETLLER